MFAPSRPSCDRLTLWGTVVSASFLILIREFDSMRYLLLLVPPYSHYSQIVNTKQYE